METEVAAAASSWLSLATWARRVETALTGPDLIVSPYLDICTCREIYSHDALVVDGVSWL